MESVVKEKVLNFSALRGLRVLIAEDNMFNQIVIQDTLESAVEDVHIDMAETGLEVLDFLSKSDYHMILMDNQMPKMDGMEACRKIRETFPPPKCDIPVLALTASVLQSDIRQCLDAGMNAVIPKPFELEKLLQTLSRFYQFSDQENTVEKKPREKVFKTDFSLDFLIKFCKGDEQQVKKYAAIFEKSSNTNLSVIAASMDDNNRDKLGLTEHTMKSSLKIMGMDETLQKAENIEQLIKENAADETLKAAVSTYTFACRKALEELNTLNNNPY